MLQKVLWIVSLSASHTGESMSYVPCMGAHAHTQHCVIIWFYTTLPNESVTYLRTQKRVKISKRSKQLSLICTPKSDWIFTDRQEFNSAEFRVCILTHCVLALQRWNHIGKRNNMPFKMIFSLCIQDWPQTCGTLTSPSRALAL